MRTRFLFISLFLGTAVALSQSPSPDSPAATKHDESPTPAVDSTPAAAAAKPNVEETIATAHQKLEHGNPQVD